MSLVGAENQTRNVVNTPKTAQIRDRRSAMAVVGRRSSRLQVQSRTLGSNSEVGGVVKAGYGAPSMKRSPDMAETSKIVIGMVHLSYQIRNVA
jgi:hypothetical protein